MRTLLFTLEYPPFKGGVANYYGNLVKHWPSSAKAPAGKPKPAEISVLDNNGGRLINNKLPFLKWLPACFALAAKIKQEKIQHILVGQILPLGAAALICAGFYKIKYSVILHGLDLSSAVKKTRKKWLAGKILSRAEKIICVNGYTADLTKRFFPANSDKIITANPGVEDRMIRDQRSAVRLRAKYHLKNKIVLLSVGRLVKRKGFDKVIEALPEVLKQISDLSYVILGDGEELNNFQLKITNYKLDNYVKIITDANDNERDAWYDLSDIFIMPSRNINGDFEGFGIVYLEANLAGKPVIAGKSGGVGDAVVNGLNGLSVNPENADEIARAIVRLARDKDLRQKLGEQGRERVIEEFNWEKQVKKIYEFII